MAHMALISINDRCNLGARILSAIAKQNGHQMDLIFFGEYDTRTYEFSIKYGTNYNDEKNILLGLLKRLDPDIIGFSFRSTSEFIVRDLARAIKKIYPRKYIILGGIGATSHPVECIKYSDFLCEGEGDYVLPHFLETIDKRRYPKLGNFVEVPNLWINWNGAIYKTKRIGLVKNLDELPYIDYDPQNKFTVNAGKLIEEDGRYDNDLGAYPLLTSRGCPFACTFCHNSLVHKLYRKEKYCRRRSVGNVINELILEKKRNPELKMISIYDDSFTGVNDWVKDFCEEYKKYIQLPFWCFSHPLYIEDSVVGLLAKAGCNNIGVGCQSFSEHTLFEIYNRKTPLNKSKEAFQILKEHDINVQIDLISFNPLEREADKRETFLFLLELPKNTKFNSPPWRKWSLSISRLTLFPNTEIFHMIKDRVVKNGEYSPVIKDEKYESFWEMLYLLTFHDYLPQDKLLKLSYSYDDFNHKYPDCTVERGIDYINKWV